MPRNIYDLIIVLFISSEILGHSLGHQCTRLLLEFFLYWSKIFILAVRMIQTQYAFISLEYETAHPDLKKQPRVCVTPGTESVIILKNIPKSGSLTSLNWCQSVWEEALVNNWTAAKYVICWAQPWLHFLLTILSCLLTFHHFMGNNLCVSRFSLFLTY